VYELCELLSLSRGPPCPGVIDQTRILNRRPLWVLPAPAPPSGSSPFRPSSNRLRAGRLRRSPWRKKCTTAHEASSSCSVSGCRSSCTSCLTLLFPSVQATINHTGRYHLCLPLRRGSTGFTCDTRWRTITDRRVAVAMVALCALKDSGAGRTSLLRVSFLQRKQKSVDANCGILPKCIVPKCRARKRRILQRTVR
jgi:hypothetical protein